MIPTMLLSLLKSYWKHLIVIIAIVGASYFVYNHVYTKGYDAAYIVATQECNDRMMEYNKRLDSLITKIEDSSNALIKESQESRIALKKDVSTILSTIKNKPLYTIEHGKCKPSDDFIDTYNKVVERVNQ